MPLEEIKKIIRKIPILGPKSVEFAQFLGYKQKKIKPYNHVRIPAKSNGSVSEKEIELIKVKNLLNYTKTSGNYYAATNFDSGYQTMTILDKEFKGRRNPKSRIELIPLDFKNKKVLDIGSNQGGMLFELSPEIMWGVGIDYDYKMVNVSNRIRSVQSYNNLSFYQFNLDKEDLNIIEDFLPGSKPDVIFLLAVCRWIKKWKEVIRFCAATADILIIETNGSEEHQEEQRQELLKNYNKLSELSSKSDDDPESKERKLFLCEESIRLKK